MGAAWQSRLTVGLLVVLVLAGGLHLGSDAPVSGDVYLALADFLCFSKHRGPRATERTERRQRPVLAMVPMGN